MDGADKTIRVRLGWTLLNGCKPKQLIAVVTRIRAITLAILITKTD